MLRRKLPPEFSAGYDFKRLCLTGGAASFCHVPNLSTCAYARVMHMLRPFLLILLSFAVGLTPVTALASHRGGGDLRTLVICTEAGIETITLDGEDTPSQSGHRCFDCCLAAELPTPNPKAFLLGFAATAAKYNTPVARAKRQAVMPSQHSRAPPAKI
ncbi:MAG TPA: hypothetical protein DD416_07600 [Rhodobacteraceae bacterium]|nr:hypothetical protein [Paracoccaceae bacterium]